MSDATRPRTPPTLALAVGSRRALAAPVHLWRRSLRVRTVVITLVLSSIALFAVGSVVSYTIGRGLFEDRKDQVLAESARAVAEAQDTVNGASASDARALLAARFAAIARIQSAARPDLLWWTGSTTTGGLSLGEAFLQQGERESAQPAFNDYVSTELRTSVGDDAVGERWQSVAVQTSGGRMHPGIVVGNALRFGAGRSELYLVYDIEDVQTTLGVVQQSLLIGGLALLLLITLVTTAVATLVVAPLKQAAVVSEQLAAGHLDRRIPERGEDVVAVLARSFNRMAESLQRQITQLGNLSRMQQRFVSDVSHELRTPLTTIRLATDVIYSGRDAYDQPTSRSAELLQAQVQRFETLLADLLEISRMDAQAADLTGEPTNLVDVAREAIDSLGNLADETGTSVHLVAPGGYATVDADERRIARVVRNLLANALEHGESRPVVVTVDSSATAVALGVRDHGIGMSEADAQRVFDRFWRADPSRQRRIGGTGLGLAISLEDALLHGGSLEVWSRRGDGTNFVLTLPRRTDVVHLDRPVPVRPSDALPEGATRTRPTAVVGS